MKKTFTALFIMSVVYYTFGKECTNTAPFLEHMVYGYDLSEYDLYGCPEIGGRRSAIINISECSWGRKYEMSDVYKTTYEIPDAIRSIIKTDKLEQTGARLETHFDFFYDRYMKSRIIIHTQTSDVGMWRYYLKNSEFYKEIRKMFAANTAVGAIPYHYSTLNAHVETIVYPGEYRKYVLQQFKTDVDELPDTLTGNEEKFLEFIRKYGTHFISTGGYGGLIQGIKAIKNIDVGKQNKTFDNDRYNGVVLSDNVEVMCQNVNSSRKVFKVFDRDRNYTQVMTGYKNHTDFRHIILPMHDLKTSPALWLTEMRLISDLISRNQAKRESLENAIRLHMVRSANKGAVDIIKDIKKNQIETTKSTHVLNKYNKIKDSHDVNVLRKLNEELEEALEDISRYKIFD